MYIGKLAERCGVSTKTIRYYEAIGLLPAAQRQGSYRLFSERDVERVRLIKQSQQLGFQLSDIKQAIADSEHGIPWRVIEQLIAQKMQAIANDIKELQRSHELLQHHQAAINACLANNPGCQPPLS